MNDQIILNVTKRNGGLEVKTSGMENDKIAALLTTTLEVLK